MLMEQTSDKGFVAVIGVRDRRAEDGRARLELDATEERLNRGGAVHGGVLATLVDAAMGDAQRPRASTVAGSSVGAPKRASRSTASGRWRCARSSPRRKADPAAMGCTAEQWSCTRPGTIAWLDRVPPPISSPASNTVTSTPSRARAIAPASPFGPAPTTTALVIA
jgi:hypothetical protein